MTGSRHVEKFSRGQEMEISLSNLICRYDFKCLTSTFRVVKLPAGENNSSGLKANDLFISLITIRISIISGEFSIILPAERNSTFRETLLQHSARYEESFLGKFSHRCSFFLLGVISDAAERIQSSHDGELSKFAFPRSESNTIQTTLTANLVPDQLVAFSAISSCNLTDRIGTAESFFTPFHLFADSVIPLRRSSAFNSCDEPLRGASFSHNLRRDHTSNEIYASYKAKS